MRAGALHVGRVPCRALRVSYVGELGWEIYAPVEFGRGAVGHAVGGRPAARRGGLRRRAPTTRCGSRRATACGARTSTRSTTRTRPAWAGLVRLDKDADFIGREAAEEIKERGVPRQLCCLVTDDPAVMLVGKEPILDGDTPVGYVTSAGYGATIGESILYGYLPVELAEPGTALAVHSDGADHAVTVVSEPRFDPEMARLKDVAAAAS